VRHERVSRAIGSPAWLPDRDDRGFEAKLHSIEEESGRSIRSETRVSPSSNSPSHSADSILCSLSKPTPRRPEFTESKRPRAGGRGRHGCRRNGGRRTAEVTNREPALEASGNRTDAILRGACPARPPGENRNLGAVLQARERALAGVVRQHHAGRPVSRTSNIDPPTDGKDGSADTDRCGRAMRSPRESHRNLLVAA